MINKVKKRHRYLSMFFSRHKRKHKRYFKCEIKTNITRVKETLYLPSNINIIHIEERKELIRIIDELHICIHKRYDKIYLDFRNTEHIHVSGMILLYAEVKNILNSNNEIKFECRNVVNNKVSQVLKQIGFYNICNQTCSVKNKSPDVVKWRVCSGVEVISQEFDDVVDNEKEFKQLPPECDLFGACVEATMNVRRHAYIKLTRKIPVVTDVEAWWCFSQVKDNKLTVVVCDLGVSIPCTIPFTKQKFYKYLKLFGKNTDANIIKMAALEPSSRTKNSYQGNGLPKIAEIAREHSGELVIHSRKGRVFFNSNRTPETQNYKTAIGGTIIAWTIPMEG